LIAKHGNKRLIDYARLYTDVNLNPPIQRRQDELIGTFQDLVTARFGSAVGKEAAQQLTTHYFVSTTDHHGPIVNQSFCNANLLTTATYADHNDPHLKYVIVLPCSNVSLGNITFPRGLIFNSIVDGKVQVQRLSFLPSNAHSAIVYNFRAYTEQDLKKMHQVVKDKQSGKLISVAVGDKLHNLLDTIYGDQAVLNQINYSEQMIIANDRLWQTYFKASDAQPSCLLDIEQETITAELLIRYHLFEDTIISNMLFNAEYVPLLEQYFSGIMGAFNVAEKTGTYFFWGITSDNHHRVQLWKKGNQLVSPGGSLVIDFTPTGIAVALQQKQIIPSLLLVFSTLCFYYGIKCLGGFNQINYLTAMKNAYLRMNVDRYNYRSIEVCARAQTKEMNDGYLSAFAAGPNGELLPATGLDLYLYGNAQTWPTIMDETRNITIAESLNPAMPEFYRYVYPEAERLPELAAITPEQVTELTGLTKKLKPCVTLPA
ncbi:MAG: hypothetical protein ACD_43C00066G0002, partial [uncultured bacterium]